MTIQELRQNGVKVRVSHYRVRNDGRIMTSRHLKRAGQLWLVNPRGGHTIVELSDGNSNAMGIAYCNSVDNFCKKDGVKIALQRARDAMASGMNYKDWD
jgi:hypothetical protein